MREIEMYIGEIRQYFGSDVAEECKLLQNGQSKDFSVEAYNNISITRKDRFFGTIYKVNGEKILDLVIALSEN